MPLTQKVWLTAFKTLLLQITKAIYYITHWLIAALINDWGGCFCYWYDLYLALQSGCAGNVLVLSWPHRPDGWYGTSPWVGWTLQSQLCGLDQTSGPSFLPWHAGSSAHSPHSGWTVYLPVSFFRWVFTSFGMAPWVSTFWGRQFDLVIQLQKCRMLSTITTLILKFVADWRKVFISWPQHSTCLGAAYCGSASSIPCLTPASC